MNPNLQKEEKAEEEAKKVINVLLASLPDSIHPDDESWKWCWEELSEDAQEEVKKVRRIALNFLKGENNEDTRAVK